MSTNNGTQNTTHTLYLAPTGPGAGLTSVSIGLVRALDRVGLRVHFLKPISQPRPGDAGPERSTAYIRRTMNLNPPDPLPMRHAQQLISEGSEDDLMEEVMGLYHQVAQNADVVVVEGLVPTESESYADQLNAKLASTLDAEVILVSALGHGTVAELDHRIEIAAQMFGGLDAPHLIGGIVNKINMPTQSSIPVSEEELAAQTARRQKETSADQAALIRAHSKVFAHPHFHLIGTIPWQRKLNAPRTCDVAQFVNAKILNEGQIGRRRVHQVAVCARHVQNLTPALRPGILVVTPGDRGDVLVAASMATMNGVPLAGVLLTSGIEPHPEIMKLCQQAFAQGLPLMLLEQDTYQSASLLREFNPEVALDDIERIEWVMDSVARNLDMVWLQERLAAGRELRLSPPAFRYLLTSRARAAQKRIVLPEGDEPRTIQAAITCHERRIAQCVLIGERAEINRVASAVGMVIPEDMEIIEPTDEVRQKYVAPMVELRKHKGLTEPAAMMQLEDNVVLGTMMLALGEVDGLVSGAVHTTANTVRPALQLIKTSPDAKLVSSVFFMLLPEQVLVYGDCAVNPNPNAEELADIAIQSAESAAAFGIEPRVAMISYSTGASGAGSDVEKVREATRIAQLKRPDLLIDGPLQYDAAAIASVAQKKAPDSKVAGRATVFVFPDLNTGNTTYKAVQRSAHVVSIGPMLQGLRKPVNDLSRGALVDDIIYTIALTAIQAEQVAQKTAVS
jgi:phosphate acetyltransferase